MTRSLSPEPQPPTPARSQASHFFLLGQGFARYQLHPFNSQGPKLSVTNWAPKPCFLQGRFCLLSFQTRIHQVFMSLNLCTCSSHCLESFALLANSYFIPHDPTQMPSSPRSRASSLQGLSSSLLSYLVVIQCVPCVWVAFPHRS